MFPQQLHGPNVRSSSGLIVNWKVTEEPSRLVSLLYLNPIMVFIGLEVKDGLEAEFWINVE